MAQKLLWKGEYTPWKGILSLLERSKKKYKFLHLFWHLIRKQDGSTWMLGYNEQMVGSKCVREFKIRACTRDFKLPEMVLPLCSGAELPICLQTSNDIIFLTADSEQKREEFFHCITSQLYPPAWTDAFSQAAYSRHWDDSINQNEVPQNVLRRSRSDFNLYTGLNDRDVSYRHDYTKPWKGAFSENDAESIYTEDYSRVSAYESIPSRTPPPIPARDNKSRKGPHFRPNRNEQFGSGYHYSAVKLKSEPRFLEPEDISEISSESGTVDMVENLRTLPYREPEANINGTDSPHYPSAIIEETKLTRTTSQPLHEFVQTFRSQKFKGPLKIKLKPTVNWKAVKLCSVKDGMIAVAGLSPSLYTEFHVGDVIMKVNHHDLPFVGQFYELVYSSGTDEVELQILRIPNGCLCHVILPANGGIDHLGLTFAHRKRYGVEVVSIDEDGLVFKSNQLQNSCTEGVTDPAKRVNWALVEINQKPVPLDSSVEQVEQLLRDAGIELVLVFLPMDLVNLLRDSCCDNEEKESESKVEDQNPVSK